MICCTGSRLRETAYVVQFMKPYICATVKDSHSWQRTDPLSRQGRSSKTIRNKLSRRWLISGHESQEVLDTETDGLTVSRKMTLTLTCQPAQG